MAKSTQKTIEIAELIRQSEASRAVLAKAHANYKHKLDVPSRLRESLKKEPMKWVGGSLVIGFVASLFFKSRRKQPEKVAVKNAKKDRNFFLGLLTLGLALAKPAAKVYATKLVKDYLSEKLGSGLSGDPPLGTSRRVDTRR